MGFDAGRGRADRGAGPLAPAAGRDRHHPRPRRPRHRRAGRLAGGDAPRRSTCCTALTEADARATSPKAWSSWRAGPGPRPGPAGARGPRHRARALPADRRPTTCRSPTAVARGPGRPSTVERGRRRRPGHGGRPRPGRPARRRRRDVRAAAGPGARRAGLGAGRVRRLGVGGRRRPTSTPACCASATRLVAGRVDARRSGCAAPPADPLEPTVAVRPEASRQATVLEVRAARPARAWSTSSARPWPTSTSRCARRTSTPRSAGGRRLLPAGGARRGAQRPAGRRGGPRRARRPYCGAAAGS